MSALLNRLDQLVQFDPASELPDLAAGSSRSRSR